jgi:hypothetical protein
MGEAANAWGGRCARADGMATQTTDTWLGGTGDWSDAANWSLGEPGTADNASFGAGTGIDATFTATDTVDTLLDPANAGATLELDAGALTLLAGGTWAGVFDLTNAAALAVAAGTLALGGIAALDGAISGAGTIDITGSAEAALLTLTGSAVLLDLGTIGVDGALTLGTAATLSIGAGGTFDLLGDDSIGTASTAAAITNAGLLAKAAADGTSFVSAGFTNTGTISVALGTLALDAGNDLLGGTITGGGELDLRGGGTYALAAGLALSVGAVGIFDQRTTVTLGGALSYAGAFTLGDYSRLDLGGQMLTLTGRADALLGTVAGPGTLAVLGTAEANLLRLTGGAVLTDRQTVVQDGLVQLGTGGADAALVTIAAGATYDLIGDVSLEAYGGASIANAGTFAKLAGLGTSIVFGTLSSSGAILVDAGTLSLFGPAGTLGGSIAGAGELDLRGGGQFTLAAGIGVSVATLGVLDFGTAITLDGPLDYAGGFTLGAGATIDLAGESLVLSASSALGGTIAGPGTVIIAGTGDVTGVALGGSAELEDQRLATQEGTLALGSVGTAALLTIESSAAYELVGDSAVLGAGEIINTGLLAKIGGDGVSTIAATLDNGGTVAAEQGTLAFTGGIDNEALLEVGGFGADAGIVIATAFAGTGGTLRIGVGGTAVLEAGVAAGETIAFTGTAAALDLADPASIAGTIIGFTSGDTIDLTGIAANGLSYANGTLTITESADGTVTEIAALDLPGIASPDQLALANDGSGGTAIEFAPITDAPPTITADYWIAGSGNWSSAGNWALAGGTQSAVPGPGNQAVIVPAGSAAVVVSYDMTDSVAGLIGSPGSSGAPVTLAIGGGALTVTDGGAWAGVIAQSAGTLDAIAGLAIGNLVLGSLATAEVDSGVLALAGGSLAGTIDGAGELEFEAGAYTLQPGAAIDAATLEIAAGAVVGLGMTENYAGDFVLAGGTVVLNGASFELGGIASLQGVLAGPGTLAVLAGAELDGFLVSGSAELDDRGTITALGTLTLGAGAADQSSLVVETGATYALLAGAAIAAGGTGAAIVNAGLVEASGGADGTIGIAAGFTNAGTLDVAAGELALASGVLGGTLEGGGTLLLGGGNATLAAGVSVQVATLAIGATGLAETITLATTLADAGAIVLAAGGMLDLNGQAATLSGDAQLAGTVAAGGTASALILSGTAAFDGLVLSGPVDVSDTGTVVQQGALTLAGTGPGALSLAIAAGATYAIAAGAAIAASGSVTLSNAGLLGEIGGFGNATIAGNLVNTGTILVGDGTLVLAGGSTDVLAGTLAGAGEIDLEPGGTATLAPGLVLAVATLGLDGDEVLLGGGFTYGGAFVLGSAGLLADNGFSLVLSGAAILDGTVANSGGVTITGSAQADGLALAGGATLDDSGMIAADGGVMLGTAAADTASVVIGAGATFALLADANIDATGTGVITNNGLLEVPGGSGIDYVFGNFTNAGTIAVAGGTLALMAGSALLGGLVTGAGELDLAGSGTYTLSSTLTLAGAALAFNGGAEIVLASSRTYTGELGLGPGTTLALSGHMLTVSTMPSLDGVVQGVGTLAMLGRAEASGLILEQGAVLDDAGTVLADGAVTLGSGTDTAILDIAAASTFDLVVDAGVAADGNVIVNNAGVLEKTSGSGTSTIAAAVDNTASIAVTAGTLAFAGNLANDGQILVAGGGLVIGQSLVADSGNSGTLDIASGELVLESSVSSVETITFAGSAGTLALAQPTRIFGTIGGFGNGDTIDLTGASFTSGADVTSFSGHVLSISNGGTTIATLNLAGNYLASEFELSSDGAQGTDVTARIPCFLAGSRIRTPRGDVPVERLAIGDRVTTRSGHAKPIVWIGHRSIGCSRHAAPETVLPVRIRAGAFGPDLPVRDLLLSPDHCVFAQGVLIPITHLINGISVHQVRVAEAAYFHVELPAHDVLLAEALPVESYLDSGNRGQFGPGAVPHPGGGYARACAPLCVDGPELGAVKRQLLARLAATGVGVSAEPELALIAAGRTMRATSIAGGLHRFVLPGSVDRVRIVSRHGVPAELEADSTDRRRLGVAVEGIVADGCVIALDDVRLGVGFHGVEHQGPLAWRWTNGAAELAIPPDPARAAGPRVLDLLIRAVARSWVHPRPELTRAA